MIEQLTCYITRLLVGSFVVFGIRVLAGKGPHAEPLRLACACFMTILVLRPAWTGEFSLEMVEEIIAEAQTKIDWSIDQAEQEVKTEMYEGIGDRLTNLLALQGLDCVIDLRCKEEGIITDIQFRCKEEYASEAAELLGTYTGLSKENIIYMGEEALGAG